MHGEKMLMDARHIGRMVSVDPTRICLPYDWKKIPENAQDKVYQAVCNSGIQDFDNIADIEVFALIKPQRRYITCGFKVKVRSVDGSTYTRKRLADLPDKDACKVLNVFFSMGAPGMDKAYSTLFHNFFNEYLSR